MDTRWPTGVQISHESFHYVCHQTILIKRRRTHLEILTNHNYSVIESKRSLHSSETQTTWKRRTPIIHGTLNVGGELCRLIQNQ